MYLVDPEVLADVDDPAAQACSGSRLAADDLGLEAGAGQVVLFSLHTFILLSRGLADG